MLQMAARASKTMIGYTFMKVYTNKARYTHLYNPMT